MLRQHRNLLSSLNLSAKDMLSGHIATRLNGYVGGFGTVQNLEEERKTLGLNEAQVAMVQDRIR